MRCEAREACGIYGHPCENDVYLNIEFRDNMVPVCRKHHELFAFAEAIGYAIATELLERKRIGEQPAC